MLVYLQPVSLILILIDIARGLEYLHGRSIVHGGAQSACVLSILCLMCWNC